MVLSFLEEEEGGDDRLIGPSLIDSQRRERFHCHLLLGIGMMTIIDKAPITCHLYYVFMFLHHRDICDWHPPLL
jgi:hypothetical protein